MIRLVAVAAGAITLLMGGLLVYLGAGMMQGPQPKDGPAHPADGITLLHVAPLTVSVLRSERGSPADRIVEVSFWLAVPDDAVGATQAQMPRLRDAWNRDLYAYLSRHLARNRRLDLAGLKAQVIATARKTVGHGIADVLMHGVLAR